MRNSTRDAAIPSRLHVVVEPQAGYTLPDILAVLERTGATSIDLISAEFVSAEILPSSLPLLEPLAFVEVKKPLGLA